MGKEGGCPPRLARTATGRQGDGEMRSTQDVVLAMRAEIRRRGAAKNVGLRGGGTGGQRRGSHAGKPGPSRAGVACAGCEREREATRDGRAGAT